MKLDANALRYLDRDEWRILTAIEIGQKSHEIVPTVLIESIAKLKHGGVYQKLCNCLKHKLVHHEGSHYDGYRLTTLGYDFLAIHTLTKRGVISSVGRQIGVGKESDIFEVAAEDGTIMALKLHRLGRTSFRAVKEKRDYLKKGNHYSWLYLSRLAAIKEYAFMKALGERGLPVPTAIDQNRHAVLMEKVDALQLAQVKDLEDPAGAFEQMIEILCSMARVGLVHCDFNEFNVLLCVDGRLVAIDFPQMVSVSHENAKMLFERDLNCIIRFFTQKLKYNLEVDGVPCWEDLLQEIDTNNAVDTELHASGFKNLARDALAGQREPQQGAASGTESEGDSDTVAVCCAASTLQKDDPEASEAGSEGKPGRSSGAAIDSIEQLQGDEVGCGESHGQFCQSPTQAHEGLAEEGPDGDTACYPDVDVAACELSQEPGLRINQAEPGGQACKNEARQAAMAKLQKSRKQQAQRQARSKLSRNKAKSQGRKGHVSVLDV